MRFSRLRPGRPALGATFGWLLTAAVTSGVGDGVRAGALPLLAAVVTRNPATLSGVAVAQSLPWLLLGVPMGVLNDRWDHRKTLITCALAQGALMTGLTVSVFVRATPVSLLYVAGFVMTVLSMLADTARTALVPSVIDSAGRETANGRLYIAETSITQFAGPPAGSVLFAAAPAAPFAVDALSFLAGAFALRQVKVSRAEVASPSIADSGADQPAAGPAWRRFIAEITAGLRWLRGSRILHLTIIANVAANLGSEMLFAIFPLFALDLLRVQSAEYGLLFLAYAAGAIIGAWLAPRLKRRIGEGTAVALSNVVFGAPLIAMCAWPDAWAAAALMVVSGTGEGTWNVLVVTLRQELVPEELRGRVFSALRVFSYGTMPIGAALGGVVGSALGLRWPGLLGGGLIVVTGLALTPLFRARMSGLSS